MSHIWELEVAALEKCFLRNYDATIELQQIYLNYVTSRRNTELYPMKKKAVCSYREVYFL